MTTRRVRDFATVLDGKSVQWHSRSAFAANGMRQAAAPKKNDHKCNSTTATGAVSFRRLLGAGGTSLFEKVANWS